MLTQMEDGISTRNLISNCVNFRVRIICWNSIELISLIILSYDYSYKQTNYEICKELETLLIRLYYFHLFAHHLDLQILAPLVLDQVGYREEYLMMATIRLRNDDGFDSSPSSNKQTSSFFRNSVLELFEFRGWLIILIGRRGRCRCGTQPSHHSSSN